MVGSAVWRALESKGYSNLIGKTFSELDLRNQQAVDEFYSLEKPEVVISPFWSAITEAYSKKDFNWIKNSIKNILKIWVFTIPVVLFFINKYRIKILT